MTVAAILLTVLCLAEAWIIRALWRRLDVVSTRVHEQNDKAIEQALEHAADLGTLTDEIFDFRTELATADNQICRLMEENADLSTRLQGKAS